MPVMMSPHLQFPKEEPGLSRSEQGQKIDRYCLECFSSQLCGPYLVAWYTDALGSHIHRVSRCREMIGIESRYCPACTWRDKSLLLSRDLSILQDTTTDGLRRISYTRLFILRVGVGY